jgi:uncharacterized protein (TIGR02598 family)
MNRAPVTSLPPRTGSAAQAGFSLVEIALAVAVMSFGLVILAGLLPVGIDASRQAVDSTVAGLILSNVQERLQGEPLRAGTPLISPAFYDEHGGFVPTDAEEAVLKTRRYRVEVKIGTWPVQPEGTSSLAPVTYSIFWPIRPETGEAPANAAPKLVATTATSAATGPSWGAIDPQFVPTIEN